MGDAPDTGEQAARRRRMVESQIAARKVRDPRVLEALLSVPRHEFVAAGFAGEAYADHPLPIGHGQTISQPYIVAFMTEAAALRAGAKVLEIGTGCGYQTAVLAAMGAEVFSVEIVEALAVGAAATLRRLGYAATTKTSDGHLGWPKEAPFDAIVVTAAPREIPAELREQLAEGGRMVIPVGVVSQELEVLEKRDGVLVELSRMPVRFVPMVRSG